MGSTRLRAAFQAKTCWVTGHTGFKGSWLSQWLLDLGAEVHGFSLEPPTAPALFDQLGLARRLHHRIGDVLDAAAVGESLGNAQPDFVFHLAAQSIVRTSFDQPVETFATNLLGTLNVLEALRRLKKPCAAVMITTDKCYENREWLHGYREEDPLGGRDPYSASKAAAEIGIASWRRSFFRDHPVRIASARAGNVIGGGDWAKDRIMPDCIRALQRNESIGVRNRVATRPWQFVLEPLSGYLWLAAVLSRPPLRPFDPNGFAGPFNFGPPLESNRSVAELVLEVLKTWPGRWDDRSDPGAAHEARLLHLSTDKAYHLLGWKPVWTFEKAVARTVDWYRREGSGPSEGEMIECTSEQISEYERDASRAGLPWAAESREA
jgi:CDP-glucose 4,6-dehydratase